MATVGLHVDAAEQQNLRPPPNPDQVWELTRKRIAHVQVGTNVAIGEADDLFRCVAERFGTWGTQAEKKKQRSYMVRHGGAAMHSAYGSCPEADSRFHDRCSLHGKVCLL